VGAGVCPDAGEGVLPALVVGAALLVEAGVTPPCVGVVIVLAVLVAGKS
jgi:hypothetical protein